MRRVKDISLLMGANAGNAQHHTSRRQLFERQYSKVVASKLKRLEKLLGQKVVDQELATEDAFLKYMYCNAAAQDPHSIANPRGDSDTAEPSRRGISIAKDKQRLAIAQVGNDEISELDTLSRLNMGARYELLSANKLMVDLDLGMVLMDITSIESQ